MSICVSVINDEFQRILRKLFPIYLVGDMIYGLHVLSMSLLLFWLLDVFSFYYVYITVTILLTGLSASMT